MSVSVSCTDTVPTRIACPPLHAGAPGKLSYGSYASFIALLNFGWWLVTIAVTLVMAASLCWLTVAFATSSAVTMGVR